MGRYFQALAVDYDGTLTEGTRPTREVLDALAEVRRSGVAVILVTGRIMHELREVFPDVHHHVDLAVTENGAVLAWPDGARTLLAPPVPDELEQALAARSVTARRGEVLLACHADDAHTALDEIRRIGLGTRLVFNRDELMLLPPSVSKGTGLLAGLRDLGLSFHNTIAIGDAENDHSLLTQAEIGVAVANAVPWLKEDADVVLAEPDGRGVTAFLRHHVARQRRPIVPKRWRIELGRYLNGHPVHLPASQLSVLVAGGSGSGNSYLTGLLAEQLVKLRYSVLVVDREGDHVGLGRLPGVLVVGGDHPPPPPDHLADLLVHRYGSVVVDHSQLSREEADAWDRAASQVVEDRRADTGLPHWVVLDEAQFPLGPSGPARGSYRPEVRGFCFATWRPEELAREVLATLDVVVALAGGPPDDAIAHILASVAGAEASEAARVLSTLAAGTAVLARRDRPGRLSPFHVGHRATSHVRHWHKYVSAALPAEHQFVFRYSAEAETGRRAWNLTEFCDAMRGCPPQSILHHAIGGDFSRWFDEVIQDATLAARVRLLEEGVSLGRSSPDETRVAIAELTERRYPTSSP